MTRSSTAGPVAFLDALDSPMLATASETLPAGDWILEPKYDGFRALAAIDGEEIVLRSRNGNSLEERFPFAIEGLRSSGIDQVVLDGEIVSRDREGVVRFELTQQGEGEASYVIFDLLWLEGRDLRKEPLEARRELLAELGRAFGERLQVSEQLDLSPSEALELASRRGDEGLVAKKRSSTYQSRRSPSWVKLRFHHHQEFVVVGYKTLSKDEGAVGALLLAVSEGDGYRYVGRVGTGFSHEMRVRLKGVLDSISIDRAPVKNPPRLKEIVWTSPQIVAEVRYSEWTHEGQLRHPSFIGLRPDKLASEVVREEGVERVSVRLTSPDRVMFAASGLTKSDLRDYYRKISPKILPILNRRPVAVELRSGSKTRLESAGGEPDWIRALDLPRVTRRGTDRHFLVDRPAALTWFVQRGAVGLSMLGSREGSLEYADWMIVTVESCENDPDVKRVFEACAILHGLYETLSFPSVPMVVGTNRVEIFVPLSPRQTFAAASELSSQVCAAVDREVSWIASEKCAGSALVRLSSDLNRPGAHVRVPWSTIPGDIGLVAVPLDWSELGDGVNPADLDLRTVIERNAGSKDPFSAAMDRGIEIPSLA